jgi:hypothetical protein
MNLITLCMLPNVEGGGIFIVEYISAYILRCIYYLPNVKVACCLLLIHKHVVYCSYTVEYIWTYISKCIYYTVEYIWRYISRCIYYLLSSKLLIAFHGDI